MAVRLAGERGGIRGLLDVLDEHREAVEYDLIVLGLRLDWLGSTRLSWRDLLVIIRQGAACERTALYRAINGDDAAWTLPAMLLAEVADQVAAGNWQRGHGKRRDFPTPIPRPGKRPETTSYGSGAIPYDEMAAWLGWSVN